MTTTLDDVSGSGNFSFTSCQDITFNPGNLGLTLADVNGHAVVSKVIPGAQVFREMRLYCVIIAIAS